MTDIYIKQYNMYTKIANKFVISYVWEKFLKVWRYLESVESCAAFAFEWSDSVGALSIRIASVSPHQTLIHVHALFTVTSKTSVTFTAKIYNWCSDFYLRSILIWSRNLQTLAETSSLRYNKGSVRWRIEIIPEFLKNLKF